jgi:hypothetical protein
LTDKLASSIKTQRQKCRFRIGVLPAKDLSLGE